MDQGTQDFDYAGPSVFVRSLQQLGKRPQLCRSSDQAVARQGLKIIVRCARRISKPRANLLNASAKQPLREIQMIAQKLIGMLRLDPNGASAAAGKSFKLAVTMTSQRRQWRRLRICLSLSSGSGGMRIRVS